MNLDDEDKKNETETKNEKLQLVPGSYGMNVPSACTIIIIAGRHECKTENKTTYIFFSTDLSITQAREIQAAYFVIIFQKCCLYLPRLGKWSGVWSSGPDSER